MISFRVGSMEADLIVVQKIAELRAVNFFRITGFL